MKAKPNPDENSRNIIPAEKKEEISNILRQAL